MDVTFDFLKISGNLNLLVPDFSFLQFGWFGSQYRKLNDYIIELFAYRNLLRLQLLGGTLRSLRLAYLSFNRCLPLAALFWPG